MPLCLCASAWRHTYILGIFHIKLISAGWSVLQLSECYYLVNSTAAALVSSWLDYANSVLCGSPLRCSTRLQRIKIQLQGLYYSSHHYPHASHFNNFIGFLSNKGYSLNWHPLPTKYYTPVLHHICLKTVIPSRTLRSYSSANLNAHLSH